MPEETKHSQSAPRWFADAFGDQFECWAISAYASSVQKKDPEGTGIWLTADDAMQFAENQGLDVAKLIRFRSIQDAIRAGSRLGRRFLRLCDKNGEELNRWEIII